MRPVPRRRAPRKRRAVPHAKGPQMRAFFVIAQRYGTARQHAAAVPGTQKRFIWQVLGSSACKAVISRTTRKP